MKDLAFPVLMRLVFEVLGHEVSASTLVPAVLNYSAQRAGLNPKRCDTFGTQSNFQRLSTGLEMGSSRIKPGQGSLRPKVRSISIQTSKCNAERLADSVRRSLDWLSPTYPQSTTTGRERTSEDRRLHLLEINVFDDGDIVYVLTNDDVERNRSDSESYREWTLYIPGTRNWACQLGIIEANFRWTGTFGDSCFGIRILFGMITFQPRQRPMWHISETFSWSKTGNAATNPEMKKFLKIPPPLVKVIRDLHHWARKVRTSSTHAHTVSPVH